MNAVVLTSVLSAGNSTLYIGSRLLYSMAEAVDHFLQVILNVPVAAGQPHVDEDLAQDLLPGPVLRVIDPE